MKSPQFGYISTVCMWFAWMCNWPARKRRDNFSPMSLRAGCKTTEVRKEGKVNEPNILHFTVDLTSLSVSF